LCGHHPTVDVEADSGDEELDELLDLVTQPPSHSARRRAPCPFGADRSQVNGMALCGHHHLGNEGWLVRRLGIATAILIVFGITLDPFTYAFFLSYDVMEHVWWKAAIAAVDAGLILAAAVLLWRRRPVAAAQLAFVDTAFAATLGLAIGHGDLIRIAFAGWIPAQRLALLEQLLERKEPPTALPKTQP
jgi:hypothetical protein